MRRVHPGSERKEGRQGKEVHTQIGLGDDWESSGSVWSFTQEKLVGYRTESATSHPM